MAAESNLIGFVKYEEPAEAQGEAEADAEAQAQADEDPSDSVEMTNYW